MLFFLMSFLIVAYIRSVIILKLLFSHTGFSIKLTSNEFLVVDVVDYQL